MREIAGIVVINAIGAADARDDVATPVEYRKGMAVFERAQPPLLERDIRFDRERRWIGLPGPCRGPFGLRRLFRQF
jgi:hypothetical protein